MSLFEFLDNGDLTEAESPDVTGGVRDAVRDAAEEDWIDWMIWMVVTGTGIL